MNSGRNRTSLGLATAMLTVLGGGCGPVPRRDLTSVPQRQITFDDMCRLQDYFDQRNASHTRPGFHAVEETSNETAESEPDEHGRMRHTMVGEGTYVVADRGARRRLRQLIDEEYDRVAPFEITGAGVNVQAHVAWWASGQMRRLRPDRMVVLTNGRQTVELPFNPCVGEFLFGAPIYALRRGFLDAESARAHGEIPTTASGALPPVEQPLDSADPGADGGVTADAAVSAASSTPPPG